MMEDVNFDPKRTRILESTNSERINCFLWSNPGSVECHFLPPNYGFGLIVARKTSAIGDIFQN